MKLCKDCKHLVYPSLCACPANPINPVDGEPRTYFAVVCRGKENMFGNDCGPDAKYFEEKKTPTKPWWVLWRW